MRGADPREDSSSRRAALPNLLRSIMNDAPSPPKGAPDRRLARKLLRWSWYVLAGVALLCAATLVGMRILLPELGHYRPQIETWLSRVTERQVEIGAIDAHWRGWTTVFRIKDVRIGGGEARSGAPAVPAIRLADLTFSVDPLDLLRSGAFQPRDVTASGASLVVTRRPDGAFAVGGVGVFSPAAPPQGDGLTRWISSRAKLSLLASRILWVDERLARVPVPLNGVTLRLDHAGDRHRITGSFEPSATGRVDFAMEVADVSFTPSWSGSAYVAVHDVDVARLGLHTGDPEADRFSGVVSARVWSTWQGGRPVEAEGTIQARAPGFVHRERLWGFDEVSAAFKVERTPVGWRIAARDIAVATPEGSWPPSSADATWTPPRDGRDGAVVVNAGFVRIEDLVALAGPSREAPADPMLNALVDAAPHGAIEDFQVSVPITDRFELERARASGRFTGLRIGSDAWPVSVDAASGRFEANKQGMLADVVSGRLRANVPDRLAQPLQGERLAGTFVALSAPEGIRVQIDGASLATPAGTITADGGMLAPRDGSGPELDVALSLGASQITAVRSLLAGRLVPEPLSRWLESAMPFGGMHEVRLTFRGRLSETTFTDGMAELEATAQLVVPVFSYARDWPEITGLAAGVRFDGRRFDARVVSGRIMDSAIRDTTVTIEDVTADVPVVRVEGRIEGASANAVRFLAESPLRTRFGMVVDTLTIHGDSAIDLELGIPLRGSDRSIAAAGSISLDHNRIDVRELRRGLAAVNGKVVFHGSEVTSDGIAATWLGEPIHAVIEAPRDAAHVTRLSVSGRLTRRLLAVYLQDAGLIEAPASGDSPLLARVRGDSAWTAIVDIPKAGSGLPTRLHLASDLTGLSLDLPPPFGKASGTALALGVDSRITPGVERITEVRLGGMVSAALRLARDAHRFRLERGAIRIGDGRAGLPDTPGVTMHVSVPVFDTEPWLALVEDIEAIKPPSADRPGFGPVREVSIDAGSAIVLGETYPETRIHATRGAEGGWRLNLAGRGLEGVVRLPADLRAEPVSMDFERFVLETDSTGTRSESTSLDPRTLPALSFSARHFVLDDYDLGRVSFSTAPSEHGLAIERADVQSDTFEVEASGSWRMAGTEHVTDFVMRMSRVDLGRTLESLGFDGNAVAEGTTAISLRGSWKGTPGDFALERLTGVMHFLSTDGRLGQIEPGVTGHVLGLLTITSLPRRLILDFGDLFKGGFGYDRIEGRFAIENGNAYTDDLFMESDTARFEVVGRTGLVSKDYDQLVTVIPKISSSLPLVPIWVAQKLLDRNVFDKAFAYQYTITGPWDEPVVELVKTEPRETSDAR